MLGRYLFVALVSLLAVARPQAPMPPEHPHAVPRGAHARAALVTGLPIVAGCEFRNCFPSNIVASTVDWRITVSGPPGASVDLAFQSPPESISTLPLQAGTWEFNTLRLKVGESTLRNLPVSQAHRVIVAIPTAYMPEGNRPTPIRVQLTVEQLADTEMVARYSYIWPRAPAPIASSPCDQIELVGKNAGQESTVVLDGKEEGECRNDFTYSANGTLVTLGNYQPGAQSCPSEVAVFSPLNAMALRPLCAWTTSCGDREYVPLKPVLEVPVHFWIARAPRTFETENGKTVEDTARDQLRRANQIFEAMSVGIRFEQKGMENVTAFATERGLKADCRRPGPDPLAVLRSKIGFRPNMLNVYYAEPKLLRAGGCSFALYQGQAKDSILMLPDALCETLAHEFGHALRLAVKPQQEDLLGAPNIMSSSEATRECLTLGQAFRANTERESVVNRLGLRGGEITLECRYTHDSSSECPRIDLVGTAADSPSSSCGTEVGYENGRTGEVFRMLLRWLGCDLCHDEELKNLKGLKAPTVRTLAALLQDGPSVPQLARYDLHLRNTLPHRSLEASAALCKARLEYRFRTRAATALAAIGGGEAEAALARALTLQLAPDIRNHVEALLAEMRAPKK